MLYEGHLHIPGQLWYADRRVLYETVRDLKPHHCFEIGTWLGGGSTLMIARALRANGFGQLHTVEIDEEVHARAVAAYRSHLPELRPFVEFHAGNYRDVFPGLLEESRGADFFVLDGAEDGEQSLEQLQFFEQRSHLGTTLFAHDWETEKMRLVRPRLEESDQWSLERVVGPPSSVGLAVAVRRS
jgi:predicted O-methyltransferase YrrM